MSTKELTQEEINYDKMLDAMALYNKTKDSDNKKNKDKPVEEYKNELSDLIYKMNTEDFAQEELSKKEKETQEMMATYISNYTSDQYEYLVRGAWLKCEYGSHHRKLNLPTCHGVYIGQNPVMNSGDYKAGLGDEGVDKHSINISSFGVCKAPRSNDIDEGKISLATEVLGEYGLPILGESDGGVVTGDRCKACFEGDAWQNVHTSTRIGEDGHFALTTNSFLACKYGGIISVVTSGQEHIMSESDYVDKQDYDNKAWEEHDMHEDDGDIEKNHDKCVVNQENEQQELLPSVSGDTASHINDGRYINLLNRVESVNLEQHKKDFVVQIFPILYKYEQEKNIPLEIMFAQMCLESSYGQDPLVNLANNYFGIKGNGPLGSVNIKTNEVFNGETVNIKDNFRKYESMEQSIEDYTKLLQNNYSKYAIDNTPESWANALVDGGYATAPNYKKTVLDVAKYWRIYE